MRIARFLTVLLAAGLMFAADPAAAAKGMKADAKQSASKAAAKSGALLDINSASESELRQLPGIGEAYSAKIIAGRPYRAKNELVSKKIIPQATYDKIKDSIIARQSGGMGKAADSKKAAGKKKK